MEPKGSPDAPASAAATGQDRRRPYVAPALIEYGSIAKLTQSGGSSRMEASVPVMRTGCL